MNVYVAGRTNDLFRVNRMQQVLRLHGHEITFDWTNMVRRVQAEPSLADDKEFLAACAHEDWNGVVQADVVVVLCNQRLLGTAIEIGIALQAGIPILLVDKHHMDRDVVFFHVSQVATCTFDEAPDSIEVMHAVNQARLADEDIADE